MNNFNSRKKEYKSPFGAVPTNQNITLNFPVADYFNAYGVRFCYRRDGENETKTLDMIWVSHEYDYTNYTLSFSLEKVGIYWYRFEILTYSGIVYAGRGLDSEAVYGEWLPEWQLTVYDENFTTPDKYKGGVIYHVFVDRFCRSGKTPLVENRKIHDNWYDLPDIVSADGKYHGDDFFAGDLEGIRQKLDYIKSLGVNVLYLSPIFKARSNHRYDTGDYTKIDELLGNEQDFINLCRDAEKRGIFVMLDGVFNHSGSDSKYFNRHGTYDSLGAYQSKDSPYFDWYYFDNFPENYGAWWGIKNVPTLNKSNPEYRKLVFGEGGVLEKWTNLGASAWRLDVVDELPTDFVREIRKTVKKAKSDALVLGEVWEDASTKESYGQKRTYLFGEELDGVMNYPYMNAILFYALGGDKKDFERQVMTIAENYPAPVIHSLMNFLDTHDTARALNVLSGVPVPQGRENQKNRVLTDDEYALGVKRLKECAVLEYTLPGNPSVFYGDEAGVTGWCDPLNRVTFPWGKENVEILDFYKKLGKIREEYKDVFLGEIEFLDSSVLSYRRKSKNRSLLIVANNKDYPIKVDFTGKNIITNTIFSGEIPPQTAYVLEEEV